MLSKIKWMVRMPVLGKRRAQGKKENGKKGKGGKGGRIALRGKDKANGKKTVEKRGVK